MNESVLWVMLTEEEIRFLLNVTAFIEKLPESERDKQRKIRENLKTVLSAEYNEPAAAPKQKALTVNVCAYTSFTPDEFTDYAQHWHIKSASSKHSYRDGFTRVTWEAEVIDAHKLIAALSKKDDHLIGWYMEEAEK